MNRSVLDQVINGLCIFGSIIMPAVIIMMLVSALSSTDADWIHRQTPVERNQFCVGLSIMVVVSVIGPLAAMDSWQRRHEHRQRMAVFDYFDRKIKEHRRLSHHPSAPIHHDTSPYTPPYHTPD